MFFSDTLIAGDVRLNEVGRQARIVKAIPLDELAVHCARIEQKKSPLPAAVRDLILIRAAVVSAQARLEREREDAEQKLIEHRGDDRPDYIAKSNRRHE